MKYPMDIREEFLKLLQFLNFSPLKLLKHNMTSQIIKQLIKMNLKIHTLLHQSQDSFQKFFLQAPF